MREDLTVQLVNLFLNGFDNTDDLKMHITMILNDYEIETRKTDLVVYEEDKTVFMIRKFIASKLASGRSKRTCKFYNETLIKSFEIMGKPFDQLTADDVRLYLAQRVQIDGVSKTTANNERRNLSAFYTWLQKEEIVLKNPMAKVDNIKEKKKKKKAFTEYEVELIRNACRTEREKAAVELLLSTWCRVSEVVQIIMDEITDDSLVVHGKGDKDREVFLNAKAKVALENYLSKRNDSNLYLFPKMKDPCFSKGRQGKKSTPTWYEEKNNVDELEHMDTSSFEHMIRMIGKRAGVSNVHPHRFRRTGATFALRSGMQLTLVSKLLGHESIATTQIYLDISTEELVEAHKKYV